MLITRLNVFVFADGNTSDHPYSFNNTGTSDYTYYCSKGLLSKVVSIESDGSWDETETYEYDNKGNEIKKTINTNHYNEDFYLTDIYTSTYIYDTNSRIKTKYVTLDGNSDDTTEYTYYGNGLIKSEITSSGNEKKYNQFGILVEDNGERSMYVYILK